MHMADVPGEKNPADDATRGLDLRDMSTESRWFQGPSFLHEGEESWPLDRTDRTDCTEEGKQELAKISLTFQSNRSFPLLDAERFSSWLKLLRVTAWIMRFISRCKRARLHRMQASELIYSQETDVGQSSSPEKVLDLEEMKNAEKYWLRETHRERFSEELTTLRQG